MRLPLEFYKYLKGKIDIVDIVRRKVVLSKKGSEYSGLCPFHLEKSPSFSVNPAKGCYHCFGCGAGGDAVGFVAGIYSIPYSEAAIKIAGDYGIALPAPDEKTALVYDESKKICRVLEIASEFFVSRLDAQVLEYLEKRGIGEETRKEFGIGFAPRGGELGRFLKERRIPEGYARKAGLIREDGLEYFRDRITFPIKNLYGRIAGFGGRALGQSAPKYINSPETILFKKSEILYGENIAVPFAGKKNSAILVEGYTDVIALHKAGFKETMAALGTSVTEGHIKKLWKYADEILVCMDGDSAGKLAARRLIEKALPMSVSGKSLSFVVPPGGLDPDGIISKGGTGLFESYLREKKSLSETIWALEYEGKSFRTAESVAALEKTLEEYSSKIPDLPLRKAFERFFSESLWLNIKKRGGKVGNPALPSGVQKILSSSETDILGRAFFHLSLKDPSLLENEERLSFFSSLNFGNPDIGDFREFFLDSLSSVPDFTKDLKPFIERSRFREVFLVLSSQSYGFLGISLKDESGYPLLWDYLEKKYRSSILKNEYRELLEKDPVGSLDKFSLYRKEIDKVEGEARVLYESFVDYRGDYEGQNKKN